MEPVVKRLLGACKPWLTAYCPTMDLVATVSEAGGVDVWRFNGQRVFGLPAEEEQGKTVEGLAWKTDGRMLAVSFSTGSVVLLDTFAGKVAHRFASISSHAADTAKLPDWSAQSPTPPTPSSPTDSGKCSNLTWLSHYTSTSTFDKLSEPLIGNDVGEGEVSSTADLPRTLSSIDIESSLPKLSTLPPTGADDDIFSSRAAIDSVFHSGLALSSPLGAKVGMIDMLMQKRLQNEICFRMFDSFEIGSIDLSSALPKGLTISRTLATVGHPLLPDYYFVVQTEPDGVLPQRGSERARPKGSVHLLRLHLLLLNQASKHLPLLAAKATQLQNLLRYLQQIQVQLASEVRTAFDLPRRFLANVKESLTGDTGRTSFTTATYHLIVTGECDAQLKEWLVDEVGERGLKRWEKAVGDCLDLIRRMASECLLPAVERCQVVLSRLEHLARFDDAASKLGLTLDNIQPICETFDALAVLCEDMLRDVCIESREFGVFIKWLKWEAEVEGLGEDSERAEEMREAFAGEADLRTVMDYIDGPADRSRVLKYVEANEKEIPDDEDNTPPASGKAKVRGNDQFYSNFKSQRQKQRQNGDDDEVKRLPKLGALIRRLQSKTDTFLQHVAESLRKSFLLSHVAELGLTGDKIECRIFGPGQQFRIHIMSTSPTADADTLAITLTTVDLHDHFLARVNSIASRVLPLPSAVSNVYDAKWASDGSLLVLTGTGSDRQVLRYPVVELNGTDYASPVQTSWQVQQSFARGLIGAGMVARWLSLGDRDGVPVMIVSDEEQMGFAVFEGHA